MGTQKTQVIQSENFKKTELGLIPKSWNVLQLKDFLIPQVRAVQKPKVNYKGIGIKSHGKGTFLKLSCDPKDIALTTLFEVKKGDLITNITFAWEGAIAIVKDEDDGALVSHRFPTYTFNEELVLPEFFKYFILQKWFVNELTLISPGSAGRNRVLRKTDFVKIKVPIPSIDEQKKIAYILNHVNSSITSSEDKIKVLNELKKSSMKHLFTYGPVSFGDVDNVKLKETEIGKIPVDWEIKNLGEILILNYGKGNKENEGNVPIYGANGVLRFCKSPLINEESIIIGRKGSVGALMISKVPCWPSDVTYYVIPPENIDFMFAFYLLKNLNLPSLGRGIKPGLNRNEVYDLKISLPDKKIQERISKILSEIDSKIKSEEKKKENLEQLFKSLLHNLMKGKVNLENLKWQS